MSKTLTLYKFNKRVNSTKIPPEGTRNIETEVVLKSATSVDNPTFIIAINSPRAILIWEKNYAEFEGSYYWITDIRQLSDTRIEIDCKIDVLATYRAEILETKAFVLYSEQGNVDIVDTRLTTQYQEFRQSNSVTVDIFSETQNCYVLAIIGDSEVNGFTQICAIDNATCQALGRQLNSQNFWQSVAQAFDNPYEMLAKLIWMPMSAVMLIPQKDTVLQIGNYDTGLNVKEVTTQQLSALYNVAIPWQNDNMLRSSQFTRIELFLPFIGLVPLPVDELFDTNTLSIRLILDVATSDIIYQVENQSGLTIATFNGQCGSTMPLSAGNVNSIQMGVGGTLEIGSIGLLLAGATSLLPEAMLVGSAVAGMTQLVQGSVKHSQINGANSSRIGREMGIDIVLTLYYRQPSENSDNRKVPIGLPYYSTADLSTLSGFCQCRGASVAAPAMEPEIKEINDYLNGGIYLE